MTGFESWRSPEGEALAGPGLEWLPPRLTPSTMDDLREEGQRAGSERSSDIGKYETSVAFTDFVQDRPDSPYYVGVCGRAAICLRLTSTNVSELEDLLPLQAKGAQLHLHPYTRDYPILRAVLLLPTNVLEFESPLLLTNGDVQEFIEVALETERVELHISTMGDTRTICLACVAHEMRKVLGRAITDLRALEHSDDDVRVRRSVDLMAQDFPEITDGLSKHTLVVLEPTGAARPIVPFEIEFV